MKSVIIEKLIEIEEDARTITGRIEEKETELPVKLSQKCEAIEKKLKDEYEKTMSETELLKQRECEVKLKEIEEDFSRRAKKLEEYFRENHEAWETEILNRIIGR